MSKEEKTKKETKKDSKEESVDLTTQITELLEKNKEGLTTDQIALKLGAYKEEDKEPTKRNALKKIRIYARKAIGGGAAIKKGRQAIYKLGAAQPTQKASKKEAKKEEPKAKKEGEAPKKASKKAPKKASKKAQKAEA